MDFYLGSFLQFSLSFLGCYVLCNKQRLMINTESNDCTVCSYFQLQLVLCRETDIYTMLESKRRCGARKTRNYCPFFLRFYCVVCPPARCFCAECDCFPAKSPFFFISLQRQGNIKHGYYEVQGWQNALHLPEFPPAPLLKKTSMFMSIRGDLHMHHSHEKILVFVSF